MAARYFRVDVDFFHKNTCRTLTARLGPWAPLMFLSLIARAKDGVEPGVFAYRSDAVALEKLGVDQYDIGFTLDEFFTLLGRLRQTSRRRSGDVQLVTVTRYGDWQQDSRRYEDATRKARKRQEKPADTKRTRRGQNTGPSSSTSTTPPTPPKKKTKNTGPTSPTANGEPHPLDCPHCHTRQPSRPALASHVAIFHPTTAADPDDLFGP